MNPIRSKLLKKTADLLLTNRTSNGMKKVNPVGNPLRPRGRGNSRLERLISDGVNSIGDTIIEVILAIAIVSSILGGAYVSANYSLNNSRQAQERGEALKIVESQLEKLKQLADAGNTAIFTVGTSFCIDNVLAIVAPANTTKSSVPSLDDDDFTTYQGACKGQGQGGLYNLAIQRDTVNNNQFAAYARWDRVGGGGRDQVKITGKVY